METEVQVKHILVPTDFSPSAQEAVRWGAGLADAFGADLTVLTVLNLASPATATLLRFPEGREAVEGMRRQTATQVTSLANSLPRAKPSMAEGDPRDLILHVASEVGADMIVMGTQGRRGLEKALFGSVAEHVVRHSQIPVLVVRAEGKTAEAATAAAEVRA